MQCSLVSSGADDLAMHKAPLWKVCLGVFHEGVCQVAQTDPRCDAVGEADEHPSRTHAAHIAPHLKQAAGLRQCLQQSSLSNRQDVGSGSAAAAAGCCTFEEPQASDSFSVLTLPSCRKMVATEGTMKAPIKLHEEGTC